MSLLVNLGLLGFFKYFGFFVESGAEFLSFLGLAVSRPILEIILPVGISFYTFQTLSYTIDVYRGQSPPGEELPGLHVLRGHVSPARGRSDRALQHDRRPAPRAHAHGWEVLPGPATRLSRGPLPADEAIERSLHRGLGVNPWNLANSMLYPPRIRLLSLRKEPHITPGGRPCSL
jgi:hypothetical protein